MQPLDCMFLFPPSAQVFLKSLIKTFICRKTKSNIFYFIERKSNSINFNQFQSTNKRLSREEDNVIMINFNKITEPNMIGTSYLRIGTVSCKTYKVQSHEVVIPIVTRHLDLYFVACKIRSELALVAIILT